MDNSLGMHWEVWLSFKHLNRSEGSIPTARVNMEKVAWSGKIVSTQPRIRWMRSFDERSHSCLGYVLRVDGTIGNEHGEFQIAIGKAARKLGSDFEEAAHLLRRCQQAAAQTGLSFHIGTQSVNAEAYRCTETRS